MFCPENKRLVSDTKNEGVILMELSFWIPLNIRDTFYSSKQI